MRSYCLGVGADCPRAINEEPLCSTRLRYRKKTQSSFRTLIIRNRHSDCADICRSACIWKLVTGKGSTLSHTVVLIQILRVISNEIYVAYEKKANSPQSSSSKVVFSEGGATGEVKS